jgi:hypothetical protein
VRDDVLASPLPGSLPYGVDARNQAGSDLRPPLKAGDHRTCPDCGARITLQPSKCTCKTCRDTLYISEHNDSKGKPCFNSGHGWKEPIAHVERIPSESTAPSGEAKP